MAMPDHGAGLFCEDDGRGFCRLCGRQVTSAWRRCGQSCSDLVRSASSSARRPARLPPKVFEELLWSHAGDDFGFGEDLGAVG